MSTDMQIDEMACAICGNNKICAGQGVKKCILHPQMRRYAKNAYKEGYRKQSEWISVDERLPEDGETVLTISCEAEMEVCFYETAWKGVFQQCSGLIKIYNITHWMPLPEPPKMKGGAE